MSTQFVDWVLNSAGVLVGHLPKGTGSPVVAVPTLTTDANGATTINDGTGSTNAILAGHAKEHLGIGVLGGKKIQNVESTLIIGNALSVSGLTAETWQSIFSRENPFYYLRVGWLNPIGSAITIDKTAFTVSDTFDNANPKVLGADPAWTNITYAGATPVTLTSGSAANPPFNFSDWVPRKSVPWIGAGNNRCLTYIRAYVAGTGNGYLSFGTTYTNSLGGRIFFGSPMAGDKIAAPTGYTNALPGFVLPMIVETMGYVKTIRVGGIGDSTYEGSTGLNNGRASAWGPTGAAAASLVKPAFSYDNFGIAGQTTAQTIVRVATILASALKPDALIYQYYSPNDGIGQTQSKLDDAIGRALSFVQQCQDANVTPIIATALPISGQNAPDSAMRVSGDAFVRANAAAGGWKVLDLAAAIIDPTLANFQPFAGTYFDANHPNDTGSALLATAFSSFLQALS